LGIISTYEIFPIDYFRPLEIAYRNILEHHFSDYYRKVCYKSARMHVCIESSTDQVRILKLLEDFSTETNKVLPNPSKTPFANKLSRNLYSVSFPNKKAMFLGLEIADIISYGYYLSAHHRRSSNNLYKEIWEVIQKRREEIEEQFRIKCVVRI